MADRFADGWAAACDYALDALKPHAGEHTLVYLSRLRYHPYDPSCAACGGSGIVAGGPEGDGAVPHIAFSECRRCAAALHHVSPREPHPKSDV
jgi:hypothetical protein